MIGEMIRALCPPCYDAVTFLRTPFLPFSVWLAVVIVMALMAVGALALLYEVLTAKKPKTKGEKHDSK